MKQSCLAGYNDLDCHPHWAYHPCHQVCLLCCDRRCTRLGPALSRRHRRHEVNFSPHHEPSVHAGPRITWLSLTISTSNEHTSLTLWIPGPLPCPHSLAPDPHCTSGISTFVMPLVPYFCELNVNRAKPTHNLIGLTPLYGIYTMAQQIFKLALPGTSVCCKKHSGSTRARTILPTTSVRKWDLSNDTHAIYTSS